MREAFYLVTAASQITEFARWFGSFNLSFHRHPNHTLMVQPVKQD